MIFGNSKCQGCDVIFKNDIMKANLACFLSIIVLSLLQHFADATGNSTKKYTKICLIRKSLNLGQCYKDDKSCNENEFTSRSRIGNLEIVVQGTNVGAVLYKKDEIVLEATLGLKLPEVLGTPTECQDGHAHETCYEWGSAAKFTISKFGDYCYDISWQSSSMKRLKDCFIHQNSRWFGGPEEYYQRQPIDRDFVRKSVPYLPGDMLQDKDRYFGMMIYF